MLFSDQSLAELNLYKDICRYPAYKMYTCMWLLELHDTPDTLTKTTLVILIITLHLHRGFENGKLYKLCILLLPTGSNQCMTSVLQLFEFHTKHRGTYCQLKIKYIKTRLWNLPPSSESSFSCIGSASYCSATKNPAKTN